MREFTNREDVRQYQLAALQRLLAEVGARNPFWRERIHAAGLEAGCRGLDEFAQRMMPVTKHELIEDQRRSPPYGTNVTYPLAHYTRFNQTSATSGGAPLRWIDTPESWQWMVDNWKHVYRAADVTSTDHIYFAFSFGPFLGFWTAFDAATQLGCLSIPGGGLSSAARLAAMRDNHATILCCTPTYARRLAEVARKEPLDLAELNVRRIIVAGEPGGSVPAVRDAIHRDWPGAIVFDHHGMTEVGPVSYQCPREPGTLVVIESSYLAEVVDPSSLQPVPPGEVGELLLTTLGRLGAPLIRYRTGDLVRADRLTETRGGTCFMRLVGGILGRSDDMVVVRGVNVYPTAVADICAGFPEIAEYRVRIRLSDSLVQMQLDVEPAETVHDSRQLVERIAATLKSRLALTIPVTVQPPYTLPRFQMKARRWEFVSE